MNKKHLFWLLFFIFPLSVKAEITHPYVVDEKPQVLFGDTVPIVTGTTTYYGLENYTQNYVGGYAHFTFTYTHSQCCFASYPPHVYVTGLDPRSTSTPVERSAYTTYNIPSFGGIPTDWYTYDVQFDQTGHTTIVKEQTNGVEIYHAHDDVPGSSSTDWASIANFYPLQNPVQPYSIAFAPVPVKEHTGLNPVIIIPGIMGSAYKNGELVIDPILHTYDDLIATLVANGYEENKTLFTFPYEWRDSNVLSASLLKNKIDMIKTTCSVANLTGVDCSKVDLVAHSMGGLVARQYIESSQYISRHDVDQVIFLGTPHKGSPTDYLNWGAGAFTGDVNNTLKGLFFEAEALKNGYPSVFSYIHNRPILSVQELLPTFDYLKDKSTGLLRQYPNGYPENTFLDLLNSSTGMANLLNSGVRITNIIGNSGPNTIEKIRVISSTHAGLWADGEPDGFYSIFGDNGLERGDGDKTVTLLGATLNNSIQNEQIISSHNRIPTLAEGKIFNILTGKVAAITIDTGTDLDPKVLILQLLSPIDFVITAPDGKKIGKNFANGQEFNEISGAFYSGYQTDNEYITIPNPIDGDYKVQLQGTGNGGEYTVLTSLVADIVSTTTQTVGVTAPGQITDMDVSLVGGSSNITIDKTVTLAILVGDINGAYNLGWITDKKVRDDLVKRANQLYNGKTFDKKAAKLLITTLNDYSKVKINNLAYNLIKSDLDWLINN